MRISDWSSDVCSSDLRQRQRIERSLDREARPATPAARVALSFGGIDPEISADPPDGDAIQMGQGGVSRSPADGHDILAHAQASAGLRVAVPQRRCTYPASPHVRFGYLYRQPKQSRVVQIGRAHV